MVAVIGWGGAVVGAQFESVAGWIRHAGDRNFFVVEKQTQEQRFDCGQSDFLLRHSIVWGNLDRKDHRLSTNVKIKLVRRRQFAAAAHLFATEGRSLSDKVFSKKKRRGVQPDF